MPPTTPAGPDSGSPAETVTTPNGAQLAVYRSGDRTKPTVVLVHGFPDDHHVWDGVVAQLAADHDVVTYDVRGVGASSKPRRTADYRLDLLAEDLQAVIDHAGGGRGVHLVGHDWGSLQGWHLVTGARHRGVLSYTSVSGMCLDHFSGWVRRKARARRWRDIAAMWKSPLYMGLFSVPGAGPLLCRLGLVDLTLARPLKVCERPEPQEPRPAGPDARRHGVSAVRMYGANFLPRLRRGDHGGTDVPVLVLAPARDIFVPPVAQRDPHPEVRTVQVETVPGGHWAPAYSPGAVAAPLRTWIARHESAAR